MSSILEMGWKRCELPKKNLKSSNLACVCQIGYLVLLSSERGVRRRICFRARIIWTDGSKIIGGFRKVIRISPPKLGDFLCCACEIKIPLERRGWGLVEATGLGEIGDVGNVNPLGFVEGVFFSVEGENQGV